MEFIQVLWNFIAMSAPYLLLGMTFAGIIHVFISIDTIKKNMGGKGLLPVFKSSVLGIPLPLCSCSVIPTAITLRKSGASNGATSAFLISTPESGVDSIAMTYGLMDLPMTIIRPIAAFFSAFIAGTLQTIFNQFEPKFEEVVKSCCKKSKKSQGLKGLTLFKKLQTVFSFSFGDLLDDIAFWLTFGLVMGAVVEYFAPSDLFQILNGIGGKFLIIFIGVPLYICASASTPIAASLILKGMSPGTALIFLLVGPATNISSLILLKKYIGTKGIIINVLSIVIVALLFSFCVDFLYSHFSLSTNFKINQFHHHAAGPDLFSHLAGGILAILLIKSFIIKIIKK